ncbi:MAG: hypothetical protein HZY74_04535 [Brevundimonas sp.]|nr:MAG: hypothetical protein HZY74_04535 [Brevundimonas sp.]
MTRARRGTVALVALAIGLGLGLGLAGCGFTPVYGDHSATSRLGQVQVHTPDHRLGYRLREQLEDAFGFQPGSPSVWRLETSVEQSRRPLGRRLDDSAARYELTVVVDWTLSPVAGGQTLTGRETITTTYSAADQPYAAIASQQDGEERAAAELARAIRLDILRQLAQP